MFFGFPAVAFKASGREDDECQSNQSGDEPSRCGHADLPSVSDVALAIGARQRRRVGESMSGAATAVHGKSGGAIRFFVACSKAYASAINLGSLHAVPVKLTLNGAGLGSKPAGKGG